MEFRWGLFVCLLVCLFVLLMLPKQHDKNLNKKGNETQNFSFMLLKLMNHSVASVFSLIEDAVIIADCYLLPDWGRMLSRR